MRHGSTENQASSDTTANAHPMISEAIDPARSAQSEGTQSLDRAREASSIPVASPDELPKHQQTANSPDGSTTWLYPSETMFFEAMKRKVLPFSTPVSQHAFADVELRYTSTCRGGNLTNET